MSFTPPEPPLFDAKAYREKYGVSAYLRYVSKVEIEQKEWIYVSYTILFKVAGRIKFHNSLFFRV